MNERKVIRTAERLNRDPFISLTVKVVKDRYDNLYLLLPTGDIVETTYSKLINFV